MSDCVPDPADGILRILTGVLQVRLDLTRRPRRRVLELWVARPATSVTFPHRIGQQILRLIWCTHLFPGRSGSGCGLAWPRPGRRLARARRRRGRFPPTRGFRGCLSRTRRLGCRLPGTRGSSGGGRRASAESRHNGSGPDPVRRPLRRRPRRRVSRRARTRWPRGSPVARSTAGPSRTASRRRAPHVSGFLHEAARVVLDHQEVVLRRLAPEAPRDAQSLCRQSPGPAPRPRGARIPLSRWRTHPPPCASSVEASRRSSSGVDDIAHCCDQASQPASI
jgi:hypothetical protein